VYKPRDNSYLVKLFYGLDMIFGFGLMGDGKTTQFSGHNEPEMMNPKHIHCRISQLYFKYLN